MSEVKTEKQAPRETASVKRSRIAGAIRTAMHEIARHELIVGNLLLEVRGTFLLKGKVQRVPFFSWIEKTTGLKQAMAYRYMQAAEVVVRVPAAGEATRAVESLAYLSRMTDEDISATLKAAGKNPTIGKLKTAAESVSEKVAGAATKRDEAVAEKAEAEQVKADKAVGRIRKTVGRTFAQDLLALETEGETDPHNAVRLAILHGAKIVGKHGPAAVAVIRDLLKDEVLADKAAGEDDATEGL